MALIIDPDDLSQGALTSPTDAVWGSPSGATVTITSSGNELPSITAADFFEVRDHSDAENNGLYFETGGTPSTASITADKISGVNPVANAVGEDIRTFHTDASTATEKSVFINTDDGAIWLLEQGLLSVDGVVGQALYSFLKEEWKTDDDLIPFSFPMVAITPEQFEFTNNWNPQDNTSPVVQTRKLIRTAGWSELDGSSVLQAQYVGIISLGTLAEATDQPYYQLGNDPTDTAAAVDFTFADATNEAVQTYDQVTPLDSVTGFAFDATGKVLSRNDGGDWSTDGYKIGGQITIQGAEDTENDGSFLLSAVASGVDGDVTGGTEADVGTGFSFVDGGGGDDSIVRFDGGSWIEEGYFAGGNVTVSSATTGGNDGSYVISSLTTDTIFVPTASLTADTADNTAVFGPWTTNSADTTMFAAVDDRNAVTIFSREPFTTSLDPDSGKTFAKSGLADIGVVDVDNKAFRFPLATVADLKITNSDATISGGGPYDQIVIKYFDGVYSRDVDTSTNRSFGVVVDVGTHSGIDGSAPGAASVLTSADGGIPTSTYDAGTLTILDGSDEGTVYPVVSTTATTVTVTGTIPSQSGSSFVLQRATPVVATAEEIYEKVQYSLRQNSDIDDQSTVVTGSTADELLTFVGDTLITQRVTNPNTGALNGVFIEGFDSNDTNRITFTDNAGATFTFPFVAAGTINFNDNLVDDPAGEYWMFYEYTERFTNTGFGTSSSSGDTATLDSSVTDLTAELADGDYINLVGFTDDTLDGIYVLTGTPSGSGPWTVTVRRIDGTTLVDEAEGATVSLDKNPINSNDAIIVDNNSAVDIAGPIGSPQIAFDFDYDGNTQGGRTAATDAAIVIRAIGTDTAQFAETTGTITRATGLVFSVVAALERNYSNP